MQIITYQSDDPHCPPRDRWMARIRMPMIAKGGRTVEDWGLVFATSETEEGARAKMLAWWDAQVEAWRKMGTKSRARMVSAASREGRGLPDFRALIADVGEDEEAI